MTVPSGRNAGRSRASRSTVSPPRGRSSRSTPPTGTISAAKPPGRRGGVRPGVGAGGVGVLLCAGDPALLGEQVVGQPHVGVAELGRRERRPLVAHRLRARRAGGQNRHGAVEADSTPPARTTPGSARSAGRGVTTAASPLAHWRSTVSAGTRRRALLQGGHPGHVATRAHAVAEHHLATRPRSAAARRARASSGAARSAAVSAASDRPAVPIGRPQRPPRPPGRRRCAGHGLPPDPGAAPRRTAAGRPPGPPARTGPPCRRPSVGSPRDVEPQPRPLGGRQPLPGAACTGPGRSAAVGEPTGDHLPQRRVRDPDRRPACPGARGRSASSTSATRTVAPPVVTALVRRDRPPPARRPPACRGHRRWRTRRRRWRSGPGGRRTPRRGRASAPRSRRRVPSTSTPGNGRRPPASAPQATKDSSAAP